MSVFAIITALSALFYYLPDFKNWKRKRDSKKLRESMFKGRQNNPFSCMPTGRKK